MFAHFSISTIVGVEFSLAEIGEGVDFLDSAFGFEYVVEVFVVVGGGDGYGGGGLF